MSWFGGPSGFKGTIMIIDALNFLDIPAGLAADASLSLPLFATRPSSWVEDLTHLPVNAASQATLHGFSGEAGQILLIPGAKGELSAAVIGMGTGPVFSAFGVAAAALPASSLWHIAANEIPTQEAELGFLLGAYRYQTLKAKKPNFARLTRASDQSRIIAGAIHLTRELINTPANLLGPSELADFAMSLAARFGAAAERVRGETLTTRFPTIHAVGAGSDRAPEAVIFQWRGSKAQDDAPLVSLCGKGVCFDTGGYNLKPGGAMRLMRKDMGGAAITLGLASAIMSLDLNIRLELRIGCVENSVSGHAMRPSDILRTRAGLTVEVGDTDAEGRLVLCDLLHEACEAQPDWLIDVATLTGAARVALGPDIPALFCNNDDMAETILSAGQHSGDPLWRLPLHDGYAHWLETPFADLSNISAKPFAGAITAALFLQNFIPKQIRWAHADSYAWNDGTHPGKPEGGEAQTLRAFLTAITALAEGEKT
jgi:leucyl aminopeptidase